MNHTEAECDCCNKLTFCSVGLEGMGFLCDDCVSVIGPIEMVFTHLGAK